MLDVVLKCLSVVGIVLLALLAAAVILLLLVLFFPVTYRICGRRSAGESQETQLSVRLNWLFGLFRVRYRYPEPAVLTAKLLWFRLLQKRLPPDRAEGKREDGENSEAASGEESSREKKGQSAAEPSGEDVPPRDSASFPDGEETSSGIPPFGQPGGQPFGQPGGQLFGQPDWPPEGQSDGEGRRSVRGNFSDKITKIKYTIRNIYDKIKEIWKNISYYLSILREEETALAVVKAKGHVIKILRDIRPRRVKTDILFGTGSPDTTGYVYGIYCMALPFVGPGFLVTPDFERKTLEGSFEISGRAVFCVLLVNVLKAVYDRNMQLLIKKLKREENRSKEE